MGFFLMKIERYYFIIWLIIFIFATKSIIMAYNVLDIANKLLAKAYNSEIEELMSNMKLQKMLYYEQGFHLAKFGTPLFDDDIEAWMYGPVVPKVYNHYKENGSLGIAPQGDVVVLSEDEEELFDEVYDVYGAYSASGLVKLTHQEKPWKSTKVGVGNIISKESMTKFFKTQFEND